jgi:hypothetical protein
MPVQRRKRPPEQPHAQGSPLHKTGIVSGRPQEIGIALARTGNELPRANLSPRKSDGESVGVALESTGSSMR